VSGEWGGGRARSPFDDSSPGLRVKETTRLSLLLGLALELPPQVSGPYSRPALRVFAPPCPFFKNVYVYCLEEAEILVEQPSPARGLSL
jgi:hypothetical protein